MRSWHPVMTHLNDEQAPTAASTFCVQRLKRGFAWGFAAAMLLVVTNATPGIFDVKAIGDIVLAIAVLALIAIFVMTRDVLRGLWSGPTHPAFWTGAGFVGAVVVSAALNSALFT